MAVSIVHLQSYCYFGHHTHINLNSLWPNITSLFFLSFFLQYKLCVNVIYSVK